MKRRKLFTVERLGDETKLNGPERRKVRERGDEQNSCSSDQIQLRKGGM